jgi:aquaporin Z
VRAKLLTEFVGTFLFLTVVALSGQAGPLAPLAVGMGLMAMVYMGGHVSGAHYNPAVTLALFLRRVIPAATMVQYWITQLMAGLLAFGFAFVVSGHHAGIHPGAGVSTFAALAAEAVFTTALVLVVLNVAATKETAGNSYYGIAIGFTVGAGAFTVGPISGAAFNPAVGLAASLSGALFGHETLADAWIYLVGPFAGAAIGALIHYLQARPGPVPVETAEREHPA